VFGSDDMNLYAIDHNGNLLWNYSTQGMIRSSSKVIDLEYDGSKEIIFGSDDNNLYVLNSVGNLRWNYPTNGMVRATPAIEDIDPFRYGKEIVIGSNDFSLYALDNSGNMISSFSTFAPIDSTAAIYDIDPLMDGYEIVVGSDDNNVYLLNYNDSMITLMWNYSTNGPVDSSAAIADLAEDDKPDFAIGSDDGRLYIFDKTGLLFSYQTGGPIDSSPAIANINVTNMKPEVIFGSDDGNIYSINFAFGPKLEWKYGHGKPIGSSPQIGDINHDGNLEIAFGGLLTLLHPGTKQNQDPIVNPGGPYIRFPGDSVIFDGSQSFDPDGQIIEFGWDINGDFQLDRFGMFVELSWPEIENDICGGECLLDFPYPISLTVLDDMNASAIGFTELIISEVQDLDGDGIPDSDDNCIEYFNPDQNDSEFTKELVSYWTFDQDYTDQYGNNDGIQNGDVFFSDGIIDTAAEFDGSSWIWITDDDSLGFESQDSFTISAWIYPTITQGWKGIISKGRDAPSPDGWYGIWLSDDSPVLELVDMH
jgi:hypothetical protein